MWKSAYYIGSKLLKAFIEAWGLLSINTKEKGDMFIM